VFCVKFYEIDSKSRRTSRGSTLPYLVVHDLPDLEVMERRAVDFQELLLSSHQHSR